MNTLQILSLACLIISISLFTWLAIRLYNQNKREEQRQQFMSDITRRLYSANDDYFDKLLKDIQDGKHD